MISILRTIWITVLQGKRRGFSVLFVVYCVVFNSSDYEEEATQMPTLTPAPQPQKDSPLRKEEERTVPKILPKPTAALLSNPPANVRPNAAPSIPFPLLILNGVAQQSQDKGGLNLAGNHDVNKLKAGAGRKIRTENVSKLIDFVFQT